MFPAAGDDAAVCDGNEGSDMRAKQFLAFCPAVVTPHEGLLRASIEIPGADALIKT